MLLAGVLASAFIVSEAQSSVVYTYSGNNLSSRPAGYVPDKEFSPIEITLELSDDGSSLIDWTVSQPETGSLSLHEANMQKLLGLNYIHSFIFNTDSLGNVTSWGISVLKLLDPGTPSNAHSVYLYSFDHLTGSPAPGFSDGFSLYEYLGYPTMRAITNADGIWHSDHKIGNAHINQQFAELPIPEPATYAMLLAGLGLMRVIIARDRAAA